MIAAAARMSGGRKFDQGGAPDTAPFHRSPVKLSEAPPDIRSKAVAAVDQAIGRKDE